MASGRTALEIETVLERQISCNFSEVLFRAVMSRRVLKDEKMWISSSGANLTVILEPCRRRSGIERWCEMAGL